MKKPEVTTPSTSELEAKINASLSPVYRDLAFDLFNELQHYRDAPAHARQVRTDRIEAAIEQCYRDHQMTLEGLPLHERTQALHEKLENALARPGCRYDLVDVPDIRTVRRVVYHLAGR